MTLRQQNGPGWRRSLRQALVRGQQVNVQRRIFTAPELVQGDTDLGVTWGNFPQTAQFLYDGRLIVKLPVQHGNLITDAEICRIYTKRAPIVCNRRRNVTVARGEAADVDPCVR